MRGNLRLVAAGLAAGMVLSLGGCTLETGPLGEGYGPPLSTQPAAGQQPAPQQPDRQARSQPSQQATPPPPQRLQFQLRAAGSAWVPAELRLPAQRPLTVVVSNQDRIRHSFAVPALGRNWDMAPGSRVAVNPPPLRPGSYPFYCRFHRSTMVGTVVVR